MADANLGGSDNQNSNDNGGADNQQEQPNLGAIRKSGQYDVLNPLSKIAGQQFANTHDALAFVEGLIANSKKDSGGSDNQKQNEKKPIQSSGEIAELRQMIQSLQSDLKSKDTVVRQTNLQSQITASMSKNGFDPSMFDLASLEFEKHVAFGEDGSYFIKGKDGNPRLDKNGDHLTLDQLAGEILKSRPKLAKEEVRTGTGSKFGFNGSRDSGNIPNAATDPEAYKAWRKANGVGQRGLGGVGVRVKSQNN